jgi:suppressor for copper-sensitivity B
MTSAAAARILLSSRIMKGCREMRAFLRLPSLVAAVLVLGWASGADAAATAWVGDGHAAARLITADEAVGSGSTVDAGLEIRLAPGWHAYWRSPGDAGIAPGVDWAGSENLAKAEIAWPAPTRFSQQGFETAVYNHRVVLPIALTLAQPGRPLSLHAQVAYAACAEICVPYSATLDLTLPAGVASPGPEAGLIAAARAQVPAGPGAAGIALRSASVAGRPDAALVVALHSEATPFHAPDLFVEGIADGSPGRPVVEIGEGGRTARFTVPIRGADAAAIDGKSLALTLVDGARSAELDATPVAGTAPAGPSGLLSILAVALLGGLILNVMPCVLPVLSLKLLSVASQAGAARGPARIGLVVTALGVLASFALIAVVLIGLEAAGATVGWGMQFQWPWFIAGMGAVTTLFAASLWGWLPIAAPRFVYDAAARRRGAHRDAFLTGAFATLLATPCSAPFVGTAVGFALSRGPAEIAVVFLAMGLGFAAPYLAAAAVPRLVGWLPRPGRWMAALCAVLGLALAGTAVWLLFVLAALSGTRAAVGTGVALAIVLLLLMAKSRRSAPAALARTASAAAAAVLAAAIVWPAFAVGDRAAAPALVEGAWRPFDQTEIPRLVGEGKTVFIDVTAAWCLTCKLNEAAVIDRDPVAGRLAGPGIVAMRADWTRPDPAVAAYLKGFGRYGIPFNAVYGPGRPQGEALSELLTSEAVIKALDRAAGVKDE